MRPHDTEAIQVLAATQYQLVSSPCSIGCSFDWMLVILISSNLVTSFSRVPISRLSISTAIKISKLVSKLILRTIKS